MAYLHCDFHSEALQVQTSFIALLPDTLPLGKVPVIYLLHGLTDNCTGWTRYTSVERYARAHGAAVIMPEVQRSFYTDMKHGVKYFTYVSKELPEFCSRIFGLSRERKNNYIMGLSMGGYGALKCALSAPEQYAGCAGFSSVSDIVKKVETLGLLSKAEFQAIFGGELEVPEDCNLFTLTEQAEIGKLPAFYLTCGEQDLLYPENVRLVELMKKRGCNVTFEHWEGTHSWDLWDKSVALAMDYLLLR